MMAQVVAQAQKEALPQGTGISSLFFPLPFIFISSSFFFFFFFWTLSALKGVDTGAKGLEPMVTEEAKRPAPNV